MLFLTGVSSLHNLGCPPWSRSRNTKHACINNRDFIQRVLQLGLHFGTQDGGVLEMSPGWIKFLRNVEVKTLS
ncbi:hypothetical protein YC2023_120454 [Brassica napus]